MSDIWNDYRFWLMNRLRLNKRNKYSKLIALLHDIPYRYTIYGDRNREQDGVIQREYFLDEEGYFNRNMPDVSTFLDKGCSVFEMLVAFAVRIENEWIGSPKDPRPDEFFFEMLDNLDILMENKTFNAEKVLRVVKTWLDRKFTYDGYGNIMPLRENRYDVDQREVEIWRQMTAYISENYPNGR